MGTICKAKGVPIGSATMDIELSMVEAVGYRLYFKNEDALFQGTRFGNPVLLIKGNIARIMEFSDEKMDYIRKWGQTAAGGRFSVVPKEIHYVDVTVEQIGYQKGPLEKQKVRSIRFPNAFLVAFQEEINPHSGEGTFTLEFMQKEDKLQDIEIYPPMKAIWSNYVKKELEGEKTPYEESLHVNSMSEEGKKLLKHIELPKINYYKDLFKTDSAGNVIGIYPYHVGEGGVTVGYGHYMSLGEMKQKGNSEIALAKEFGFEDLKNFNVKHKKKPQIVKNSKYIPLNRIDEIFEADVKHHESYVNKFLYKENKIEVTQKQYDALIIQRYLRNSLNSNIRSTLKAGVTTKTREQWAGYFGASSTNAKYGSGWSARGEKIITLFWDGKYDYKSDELMP